DGASTFRILRELVFPLALPGIAVTGIYTFINAWGAFIIPFVLTYSPENQPGPVESYNFMGSHGLVKFGDLAVFSLLFSVPVIVLYLFMSRYFSGAFNFGGAVKEMLSEVRFDGVHKIFGAETSVEDLNLTVNAGEFLV